MWWFDDRFSRAASDDPQPVLFRANCLLPHTGRPSTRPVLRSTLTADEQRANQRLLEGPAEPPNSSLPNSLQLASDLRTLEGAIRDQKSKHQGLEQRLVDAQCELDDARDAEQRLRELLSAAEQKLARREQELAKSETLLEQSQAEHADALAEAEQLHQAESNWLRSIAAAAEGRALDRKREIERLSAELCRMSDESHDHRRDANDSFYEKSVAEDAMRRSQEELTGEVSRLRAENDLLRFELQRRIADPTAIRDSNAGSPASCKEASATTDADEADWKSQAEELLALTELLEEDAAAAANKHQQQLADLQTKLQAERNAAAEKTRQHQLACSQLLAERYLLQRQLDQAVAQASHSSQVHRQVTAELQQAIVERQSTIESLTAELESTNGIVDRQQGSLERIQLHSERIQEIQSSEFASMQSQVDQLTVDLTHERQKLAAAQAEVRRLSAARSDRIAYLSRQREQLLGELATLRDQLSQQRLHDAKKAA